MNTENQEAVSDPVQAVTDARVRFVLAEVEAGRKEVFEAEAEIRVLLGKELPMLDLMVLPCDCEYDLKGKLCCIRARTYGQPVRRVFLGRSTLDMIQVALTSSEALHAHWNAEYPEGGVVKIATATSTHAELPDNIVTKEMLADLVPSILADALEKAVAKKAATP